MDRLRRWGVAIEGAIERLIVRFITVPTLRAVALFSRRTGDPRMAQVIESAIEVLRRNGWRLDVDLSFDPDRVPLGCPFCWHTVYPGSQGNMPCPHCSAGDWETFRWVTAHEDRIMALGGSA